MAKVTVKHTEEAKGLKVGQSLARGLRFPLEELDMADVKRKSNKLRNTLNQVAIRLKEDSGRDYCVESGSFVSYDGTAVISCVVLTRLEDADFAEDDI